jgi:hypothetical protein
MRRGFPERSEGQASEQSPNSNHFGLPGFRAETWSGRYDSPPRCPNAALLTTAEKPGEKVQTGFEKEDCGKQNVTAALTTGASGAIFPSFPTLYRCGYVSIIFETS